MIVTVTLNPSVDRTIEIDRLHRGAVLRATAEHVDAGGKGINVARALSAHGHKSRAVLPVGGTEGRRLVSMLADDGVEVVEVPVSAAARSNIAIGEPNGAVTKINSTGELLSTRETEKFCVAVMSCVPGADWVVAGGSLPPGVAESFYADLVLRLRSAGVPVAIDASGEALNHAIVARPALVKPNREELSAAVGRPLRTLGEVLAAAAELRDRGAGAVLASLGADGALLMSVDGAWHGEAPTQERSAVGAGDAMLAGFLAAGAEGPKALATALAWGAAAASLPGSRMPGPADLRPHQVRVHQKIDTQRRLLAAH